MLPFGVTVPTTVPQRSEIPEGLMNYPVYSSLDHTLIDSSMDWGCLKWVKIFCYFEVCQSVKTWSVSFNPWNRKKPRICDLKNNIDDDKDYDAGDNVTGVKLWLDSSDSGQGRVAGCFDHGNLGYEIRVLCCNEDLCNGLVEDDTV